VAAPNAATYNSAIAHLRAVPGVDRVEQVNIALGGTSYFFITYRGDLGTLRSILVSRGWGVDVSGGQLRMYVPAPKPATQTPPQQSPQPTNTTGNATQNKTSAAAGQPQAQGAER
jgi:hypothetical protein